ncbi:MAG TPA: archease [Candidatus Acidoferrales bacterium]|nr:archease [Candidatus Acidoferrales bacterium]
MEFELLEHPADIGFRAFGETLPELFANCALALLSIACDLSAVRPANRYRLQVSSGDRESLLVDWLGEVLYWFDGKHIALESFQIDHFDDTSLIATALGEPRDPARHPARLIVKAVTWHQLRVEERDGRWLAEIYLDI